MDRITVDLPSPTDDAFTTANKINRALTTIVSKVNEIGVAAVQELS